MPCPPLPSNVLTCVHWAGRWSWCQAELGSCHLPAGFMHGLKYYLYACFCGCESLSLRLELLSSSWQARRQAGRQAKPASQHILGRKTTRMM